MIKVIIIDDEPAMQQLNSNLLSEYFPDVQLVGICDSVKCGVELIQREQPNLVLLDIELKDGTGFQILQKLKPVNFKVVFITAFDTYAIKAFKFSALDYIVKPVNEVEFQQSIQRSIEEIQQKHNSNIQANFLIDSYRKENQSKKIVLKTSDSLHIIDVCNILYCQSDNSYTTFYLDTEEHIMVSKGIKEYDGLLHDYNFFRPHQSFLVNLNHVNRIDKTDGGFIIMKNKKEIPISHRLKKNIISLLENL